MNAWKSIMRAVLVPGLVWLVCLTTPGDAVADDAVRFDSAMVPMTDGVRLATDIYLPAEAGEYPTVLIRTPYSSTTYKSMMMCRSSTLT